MTNWPPWLDEQQQAVWQDLLTVVIALPTLLDRQLERDADDELRGMSRPREDGVSRMK